MSVLMVMRAGGSAMGSPGTRASSPRRFHLTESTTALAAKSRSPVRRRHSSAAPMRMSKNHYGTGLAPLLTVLSEDTKGSPMRMFYGIQAGGFGHLYRSTAVIKHLRPDHDVVVFTGTDANLAHFRSLGVPTVAITSGNVIATNSRVSAVSTLASNVACVHSSRCWIRRTPSTCGRWRSGCRRHRRWIDGDGRNETRHQIHTDQPYVWANDQTRILAASFADPMRERRIRRVTRRRDRTSYGGRGRSS